MLIRIGDGMTHKMAAKAKHGEYFFTFWQHTIHLQPRFADGPLALRQCWPCFVLAFAAQGSEPCYLIDLCGLPADDSSQIK